MWNIALGAYTAVRRKRRLTRNRGKAVPYSLLSPPEYFLAAEMLAETETDPFFYVCLMDFAEITCEPKELERRFTPYLMTGEYRGGAFLNAVLIYQRLVLLACTMVLIAQREFATRSHTNTIPQELNSCGR